MRAVCSDGADIDLRNALASSSAPPSTLRKTMLQVNATQIPTTMAQTRATSIPAMPFNRRNKAGRRSEQDRPVHQIDRER